MTQQSERDQVRPYAVEQLRHQIDRGRTGDKVDHPDPAAAPLGADEEATGIPLTAEAIASAHAQECLRTGIPPQHSTGLGAAWVLVATVLLCGIGLIAWVSLRS